jgi:glycosyltransferase involved in cell wall biosynthesis
VRVALDASYSVDPQPSGIAMYSREILWGLPKAYPAVEFLHCYRPKQFAHAPRTSIRNVRQRLLQPPLPTFRADIYHALNQRVDVRPAKAVVSTFHDLFVMSGEYSSLEFRSRFTAQARQAAGNSDLIIAVSEFTANQVTSLLGFDRARIRVIPHGVHQPSEEAALPPEKLILFVGALQIRKNVTRLVEAFEDLPNDWRLVLAGAPAGFGAQKILERIDSSRCRDRIEVTGYVSREHLDRLYWRASIFAFPSLDEGFGIPVLEAMAHGVPVLTSAGSALGEISGNAAMYVDPCDTGQIRSSLYRLIEDCDLRKRLSRLGQARAKLFTWRRTLRETYSVYEELAK